MSVPPRPCAAASVTRQAENTATIDLRDIPEIEPEDDEGHEQVSAESLVADPTVPVNRGEVATAGALLGQAPDLSLFVAPAQAVASQAPTSLERHESPASRGVPSSIAPTISDLDVVNFAQQARRSQSTRALLALAAVAIVGVSVSVAMQGAPASGALQSPRTSAAAAKPPMPSEQRKDLAQNGHRPIATVTHSAVRAGSDVVGRQAPLAAPATDSVKASTTAPTPKHAPSVLVRNKTRSLKVAREPLRAADESPAAPTSAVAVEGGPSWLVRAQQQEAAERSP